MIDYAKWESRHVCEKKVTGWSYIHLSIYVKLLVILIVMLFVYNMISSCIWIKAQCVVFLFQYNISRYIINSNCEYTSAHTYNRQIHRIHTDTSIAASLKNYYQKKRAYFMYIHSAWKMWLHSLQWWNMSLHWAGSKLPFYCCQHHSWCCSINAMPFDVCLNGRKHCLYWIKVWWIGRQEYIFHASESTG